MQVGGKFGMQTMEAAVMDHVSNGRVTLEEARKRMPDLGGVEPHPAQAVSR